MYLLLNSSSVVSNTSVENPLKQPTAWEVILVFFGFVGIIFLMSLIKKIWYRFVLKKRYYIIPRTQIKGIANIAMVISITVGIIVALTIVSANGLGVIFRAYVGTRMGIEGILIKIGGIIFGPFLGIFIGAMTDILTVVLTSGIFHYGYFIAAIGYGLVSGLVKTLLIYSRNNNFSFAALNTGFLILLSIIIYLLMLKQPDKYTINSFIQINLLTKDTITFSLIGLCGLVLLIIWVLFPLSKKQRLWKKKERRVNVKEYGDVIITLKGHNNKQRNWYSILIATIMVAIVSQIMIDVFLLPVFDTTLSTIQYNQWLGIRFVLAFPLFVFNAILLFFVYWIISPIIQYEYINDMVEYAKVPLNYN